MLFMEEHVERWRQQDLLAGPPIQLHEKHYYIPTQIVNTDIKKELSYRTYWVDVLYFLYRVVDGTTTLLGFLASLWKQRYF